MGSIDRDHSPSKMPNVSASSIDQPGPRRRRERNREDDANQFDTAAETATQDLRALQALTDTALSHLSLDDLLPALLQRVTEVLGVDNAAVFLLESTGQMLTMEAAAKVEVSRSTLVQIPVGHGVTGRIAATRAPLVVDDIANSPIAAPLFHDQFHSLAGVPLEVGDQLLGVILVGTTLARHFTARDVQLLQQVADRMALAIDRARLYTREQEAREKAEAALARAQVSEHRYQRLVEANIIGIIVGDDECVLEANEAFLQMVGYTQADVQAGLLNRETLTTPDTHVPARRALREALVTGASPPFEREYVRKDGTRVPVLVGRALLQRDPVRFVNFVLDLTELKRLEQALAERVAQLEAVTEAVPDALAVYDTNGTVLLQNSAADELLTRLTAQTAFGETVGQRYQQAGGAYDVNGTLLQPEQLPMSRALRGEVLAGSDAVTIVMHPPSGEPIYFSLTGGPLRDADGRITGAATTARDITEQKRLERERVEQAEQLDRIFEHIADGLLVHNVQGQPVRLNAAARRILGLDAASSEYAQLPASDRATLYEAHDAQGRRLTPEGWPLMRMLSGQVTEPHTREMRLRTLNGREVEVIYSLAPLRDQEAHVVGAVTILHDQTEQKRLAREREEAHAHELALEDTTRHMDEFLATASHDLRTPLTVVKSQMQLALRRFRRLQEHAASSPEVLPNAENAELEAVSTSLLEASYGTDRLTRLVTMLFDVAQARSGTLQLKRVPCDLAELVRRNVAAQQAAVPERRIEVDLPDAALRVEADADRLDQVLTNYLTNALKYSSADQPVTVRLEMADNQAVVKVEDHGPGLPPEEQSHIWEVFHRVPGVEVLSGSGEASGSLGLGLHICKHLIELHPGGSVGVNSAVGAGSTFWFRLPLAS